MKSLIVLFAILFSGSASANTESFVYQYCGVLSLFNDYAYTALELEKSQSDKEMEVKVNVHAIYYMHLKDWMIASLGTDYSYRCKSKAYTHNTKHAIANHLRCGVIETRRGNYRIHDRLLDQTGDTIRRKLGNQYARWVRNAVTELENDFVQIRCK